MGVFTAKVAATHSPRRKAAQVVESDLRFRQGCGLRLLTKEVLVADAPGTPFGRRSQLMNNTAPGDDGPAETPLTRTPPLAQVLVCSP